MKGNRVTWVWAGLWALGINLTLFILMPGLLDSSASPPVFEGVVPQINVIRMKREESPAKQKAVKRPDEDKKLKQPPKAYRQLSNQRLSLPFEINTKLAGMPTGLEVPMANLNVQDLDNIFGIGDLDQPLMTLTRIPPFYPLTAKRKGIEGWVNVKFIVNETGRTESVSIIEAQPVGVFEASVRRCVEGWRFKPGTVGGEPVRVWAETTIRFELE